MTMTASNGNRVVERPGINLEDLLKDFGGKFLRENPGAEKEVKALVEMLKNPTITWLEFNSVIDFAVKLPFNYRDMPCVKKLLFMAMECTCFTIKNDRGGSLSHSDRHLMYSNLESCYKTINNPTWENYLRSILTMPTGAV